MISRELEFESISGQPPTPEEIFDGLMFDVEARYMQALTKQIEAPGVIWLKSRRLEGHDEDGLDDEQVMWFRLGEAPAPSPYMDSFDIGLAVEDPAEQNPIPVVLSGSDKHFYVRFWSKRGSHTKVVYPGNAPEASSEGRPLLRHSIKGLSRKLQEYHLLNLSVWQEDNGDDFDGIVA